MGNSLLISQPIPFHMARTVTDNWSIGVTGKIIEAKISGVSAAAYAGDLGTMYRINEQWNLAAVLAECRYKIDFSRRRRRFAGYGPMGWRTLNPIEILRFLQKEWQQKSGLTSGHFGMEWKPLGYIALRTGYRTDTTRELGPIAGFSAGLGFDVWGQELSYAWLPYGDLGNTQYFSLLMRFGQKARERQNLIQYQSIKRVHVQQRIVRMRTVLNTRKTIAPCN